MADAIEVLLVQANPNYVKNITDVFKMDNAINNVSVVADGSMALAYLRREGPYAKAVRPQLIVLDLQLPKKSGRELLAEIKSDPKLKSIPCIVLTTNQSQDDVVSAYRLGAGCYMVMSDDLHTSIRALKSLAYFWLNSVKLPPVAA